MNLQTRYPTTPDEFLRWNEGREGKRELVNGRVVEMMVRVTRAHAELVTRLLVLLATNLDRTRFSAFVVDLGIKTPAGVRYPDLVVDAAEGDPKDLAVRAPILVCEVLSPSSVKIDLVEKLADSELQRITESAGEDGRWNEARSLFCSVALSDEFVEFLTLPAYERMP